MTSSLEAWGKNQHDAFYTETSHSACYHRLRLKRASLAAERWDEADRNPEFEGHVVGNRAFGCGGEHVALKLDGEAWKRVECAARGLRVE